MFRKRTGIIFIDQPPALTAPQISVVSDILRNIGLLMFGSTILPYLFANVDKPTIFIVVLALLVILLTFSLSIIIVRNIKNYES